MLSYNERAARVRFVEQQSRGRCRHEVVHRACEVVHTTRNCAGQASHSLAFSNEDDQDTQAPSSRMAGKTVMITGANRGIGLAFTEHYVRQGWKVVASARNLDTADEVRDST